MTVTQSEAPTPGGAGVSAIPDIAGSGSPEEHSTTGLYMTPKHRYFWNGRGPFPSVTTILGVLDKGALVQWAKREVASSAIRHLPELPRMVETSGTEQAIRWLASTPDHVRDVAASLGSSVHRLADMESRGAETAATPLGMPEGALPYLEAFRGFLGWLRGSGGTIVSSEKAVINLIEGYGGTFDLLMRLDGRLWLVDIKTSKGIYAEYGLQLAGYSRCQFIGLPADPREYALPPVDRFGILHLRPELYPDTGWRLAEFGITDRDYIAFLGAKEVYEWKREGRFKNVGGVRS